VVGDAAVHGLRMLPTRGCLPAALLAIVPVPAAAHGGARHDHGGVPALADALTLDPWTGVPLAVLVAAATLGWLRRARAGRAVPRARLAAFAGAVLALGAALVWPLDALGEALFSAHMAQHMLLIALAPPLWVAARTDAAVLAGLPRGLRAALVAPRRWRAGRAALRVAGSLGAATVLHAVVLWAWHVPAAFEAALRDDAVHRLEHLSFLVAGLVFWRAVLDARGPRVPAAVVALFVTLVHSGMLGALITLAPSTLYPLYATRAPGVDPLADQQLAGLLMWVPMAAVYVSAALAIAVRALGADEAPGPPAQAGAGAVGPSAR
jgi:putative membrane protein